MSDETSERDAQDTQDNLSKATRNLAASRNYTQTANDYVWETFDGLFKTVYRQTQRVKELEARLDTIEQRLLAYMKADQLTSQALDEVITTLSDGLIETRKVAELALAGQQIELHPTATVPRCAECSKPESEVESGLITFFRPDGSTVELCSECNHYADRGEVWDAG